MAEFSHLSVTAGLEQKLQVQTIWLTNVQVLSPGSELPRALVITLSRDFITWIYILKYRHSNWKLALLQSSQIRREREATVLEEGIYCRLVFYFYFKQEDGRKRRITFSRQVTDGCPGHLRKAQITSVLGSQPGTGRQGGLCSLEALTWGSLQQRLGRWSERKTARFICLISKLPDDAWSLIWIIPASLRSISKYWLSAYCLPGLTRGILGDAQWAQNKVPVLFN